MAYLPATYQPWNMPQISAATPQTQGLIWVDGEVGAKAYQLPPGWPANTPIALWDTNDTMIYLKITKQMGMPNPLQKLQYQMIELISKRSGTDGRPMTAEEYATREELIRLREEIDKLKEAKE